MVREAVAAEMFTRDYADVFEGDDRWRALPVPSGSVVISIIIEPAIA